MKRVLFFLGGSLCLGLGGLGALLPGLPTTPFVLAAAYCYARSSQRAYNWLLANRLFGPMIQRWQDHRCVSRRAKQSAVVLMLITFGITLTFFITAWLPRVIVGGIGLTVASWLVFAVKTCPESTEVGG